MHRIIFSVAILLTFITAGFADSWQDVSKEQVKPIMELIRKNPFIISYCRGCSEKTGSIIKVDSVYTAESQWGGHQIMIKGKTLYRLESSTTHFSRYEISDGGNAEYNDPLSLNYNLALHEDLKWAVPFCKLACPCEDGCPVEAVPYPSPDWLSRKNVKVDKAYYTWWVKAFGKKNTEYIPPVPVDTRTWYYIVADVANVRSRPQSGTEIVARLPIGTGFRISKTQGEWAFIDSACDQAIEGWVHQVTYGETPVDKNYIISRINQAPTFADTVKWCERMVALLPDDQNYAKALQNGYFAQGDTARARALGCKIRGTDPTYIAQQHGDHLRLRGVIDSLGEFRSLEWKESSGQIYDEGDKARKKEALQARWAVAGINWYSSGGYNNLKVVAPRILPTPDELKAAGRDNPEALSGYYQDIEGGMTFGISLGTAPGYGGNIYATKPMHAVTVRGILKKSEMESLDKYKKQLVQTAFDVGGLTEIHYTSLPEYDYIDVAVCGNLGPNSRGQGQQRGIFDQKRQCVWPAEEYTIPQRSFDPARSGSYDPYATALSSVWFRFGPDASYPAFTIIPYSTNYSLPSFEEHNGSFGLHLVRISKTGSKTFTIRFEYAGD